MNSIIIFDSKTGTTKTCANYVKDHLNIEKSYHVKDVNFSLNEYNNIIICTPIYFGRISKKIKQFIKGNKSILLQKNLTLVVVCMNQSEYNQTIENNFDEEIRNHADIVYGGGAYHLKKLNFIQRFMVKKIASITDDVEKIEYTNLKNIQIS